jgi:hypothetical protein
VGTTSSRIYQSFKKLVSGNVQSQGYSFDTGGNLYGWTPQYTSSSYVGELKVPNAGTAFVKTRLRTYNTSEGCVSSFRAYF